MLGMHKMTSISCIQAFGAKVDLMSKLKNGKACSRGTKAMKAK